MVTKPRFCKDCLKEVNGDLERLRRRGVRPAPHAGPRCVTHHRLERKRLKLRSHARRIAQFYGITAEQYAAVKASQGGRCYICQWATGASKALAVDHDHELAKLHDHPVEQGCPECIRALLCGPCNQMIGRHGVEALKRAIEVLTMAPAREALKKMLEIIDDDYEP